MKHLSRTKFLKVALVIALAFSLPGCRKEKNPEPAPTPTPSVTSDIFICGAEYNGTKNVAKVWKNGIGINLSDGTKDTYITAITVSGADVYTAGSEYNGTKEVAKVWKNGVATSVKLSL
jgi:hypothetical protein